MSPDCQAGSRLLGNSSVLGLVAGVIGVVLPMSHAAWFVTAALRVMKPARAQMQLRLKQQIVGTATGAVFAAGSRGWRTPQLLHAMILGVTLTLMQMVGSRRYAAWTLCLTVIALDLGVLPYETGWNFAVGRIMLTVSGLALAALFSRRLI
jgi:Fusaric acid resistance protein-like